jgi:hypothetical protein
LVLAVFQLVMQAPLAALAQLEGLNVLLAGAATRLFPTAAIEAHQQTAAVVAVQVRILVGMAALAAVLLDIQAMAEMAVPAKQALAAVQAAVTVAVLVVFNSRTNVLTGGAAAAAAELGYMVRALTGRVPPKMRWVGVAEAAVITAIMAN